MACEHNYDPASGEPVDFLPVSRTGMQGIICGDCWQIYAAQLKADLAKIQTIVDEQAEDEGLWFRAETAPEAYLQEALRWLHAAIEKGQGV